MLFDLGNDSQPTRLGNRYHAISLSLTCITLGFCFAISIRVCLGSLSPGVLCFLRSNSALVAEKQLALVAIRALVVDSDAARTGGLLLITLLGRLASDSAL